MLFTYRVMEFWKSHWVACSLFFCLFFLTFLSVAISSESLLTNPQSQTNVASRHYSSLQAGKKTNSNPHFYAARMIHKVESFSTQEYPEERSLQKQ